VTRSDGDRRDGGKGGGTNTKWTNLKERAARQFDTRPGKDQKDHFELKKPLVMEKGGVLHQEYYLSWKRTLLIKD